MATNKSRIVTYVDERIKKALERIAKAENRSVSNLVESWLLQKVHDAIASGVIDEDESDRP